MGAFSKVLAAAALAFVVTARAAHGDPLVERPPTDPNAIRWDPAIRRGVLPNGLRYAVMQNATPKGGVSIRLAVAAGSLDEAEDERGAAHFLEHMAFGGSHAQLQADVEKTFADAGVAFGRDRNAATTYLDTTYEIDLPHGDPAALDLGFRWLRQVADGAQLNDEGVGRERGVIQAEREARLTDFSQAAVKIAAFETPGAGATHETIGTEASIAALTAAKLQSFYDRWYQPADAVVVVVGDEPLDELEARVWESFASWRARAQLPAHLVAPKIDEHRGFEALTAAAPNLPTELGLCRVRSPAPETPYDVTRLHRELLSRLWSQILGERLAAAQRTAGAGLIASQAIVDSERRQYELDCVGAAPIDGQWQAALRTITQQVRRLSDAPPQEEELETALKTLRSRLRGELFAQATRNSGELADAIVASSLKGEASPSPAEAMRVFDAAVEDVTPAAVQAAFHGDWTGAGPLLTLLAPQPPTADQVRQSWASLGAAAPAVATAAHAATWNYASVGRPGKVTGREAFPQADFARLTFANGVRLNFKHTDFERNTVLIRVRYGAGRRELAPADFATAALGAAVFERGGLAKDSYADIRRLFPEYDTTIGLDVMTDGFLLKARTAPESVPTDLQILAGYATDPGFRDLDGFLPTVAQAVLRVVRASPAIVAQDTLEASIFPDAPDTIRAFEATRSLGGTDVARVLRPALTQAPLEVTIVGDMVEADAVSAVGATFGALPPRKDTPRARADVTFLRFPEHPPAALTGVHEGPPQKADISLVWPLYVAEPARRREEYALMLLARVFEDALLRRIRGDLSKTYSPSASLVTPDNADQGYLKAEVEVARGDLDLVRTEMIGVAARLAGGALTDDDVESVRKLLFAQLATQAQTNDFWASVLQGSSRDDSQLRDAETVRDVLAKITPSEVRKAAAVWMATAPIQVTITARQDAAAAPAGAKP